jgi:predicted Zn-dependent protease
MGLQVAIGVTDAITQSKMENQQQQKSLMSMLGLGAQVGVLLPFSRKHESESDLFGIDLMARAGFDPRQSVDLWQNMAAANGGNTAPEFMSTHPNPENRIIKLQDRMAHALNLTMEAKKAGKNPRCQ